MPVSRWPARSRRCRAAKWVLAPQSSEITASSAQAIADARGSTICGRSGVRSVAFDPIEQGVPVASCGPALRRGSCVGLPAEQRQQPAQRRLHVADQADFDRVAQPDAVRL